MPTKEQINGMCREHEFRAKGVKRFHLIAWSWTAFSLALPLMLASHYENMSIGLCFLFAFIIFVSFCFAAIGGGYYYGVDFDEDCGLIVTEFSGRLVDTEPHFIMNGHCTYLATVNRDGLTEWHPASILDLRGVEKKMGAMENGLYRDVRFSVWKPLYRRSFDDLRFMRPRPVYVYVLFTDPENGKEEK